MSLQEYDYQKLKKYAKDNNLDTSGKTDVLRARCLDFFNNGKKVIEETNLSDEDKIFGKQTQKEIKKVFNYEDENRLYKVYNLKLDNGYTIFSGEVIESFIGSNNLAARKALKEGAKEVTTYDSDKNPVYKIEVL